MTTVTSDDNFILEGDADIVELGYIHPDGEVRGCDIPPKGFVLCEKILGLSKEYFAVPEGNSTTPSTFPEGTLRWNSMINEWRPI